MHGLPIAFKDTHLTRDMRTTHGSPLFADHVPDTDELAPVSQVVPFEVELEYPQRIAGQEQHTYLDWMRSAYLISVMGSPALSVPAGFPAPRRTARRHPDRHRPAHRPDHPPGRRRLRGRDRPRPPAPSFSQCPAPRAVAG
ncbi:amidase family protein [Streptomyces nodosus]|uniref:amidase family protein n=1 Tax=Streptomyces nodosus TaxID=40318 RepID=UPI001F5F070A|nr:amidase family protein [Streptomyces nodosus]